MKWLCNGYATTMHQRKKSVRLLRFLHNGQIYILRGDKTYTLQGQEME